MSHEIIRAAHFNKNEIVITYASNNVEPRTWYREDITKNDYYGKRSHGRTGVMLAMLGCDMFTRMLQWMPSCHNRMRTAYDVATAELGTFREVRDQAEREGCDRDEIWQRVENAARRFGVRYAELLGKPCSMADLAMARNW